MKAPLKKDLHAACFDYLGELGAELRTREDISLRMARRTVKCAEPAARCADVRVVHVAIDDVRHDAFRMLALADGVRRKTEIKKSRLRDEPLAFGRAGRFAVRGGGVGGVQRGG